MSLRDTATAAAEAALADEQQQPVDPAALSCGTDAEILAAVAAGPLGTWFPQSTWQLVDRLDPDVLVREPSADVLFLLGADDTSWRVRIVERITAPGGGLLHYADVTGPETVGFYLADRDIRRAAAT